MIGRNIDDYDHNTNLINIYDHTTHCYVDDCDHTSYNKLIL
jgi:hypothetical protein